MTEQTSQTVLPNPLKAVFKRIWVVIAGVVAVAIFFLWPVLSNSPVDYANIDDHFKYGSIGSEPVNGIPYWIWKVLPEVFPDKLPGKGYTSLGFIEEQGKDLPIGFSKRRVFIDRVGLNCAVCHTGTLRSSPNSKREVITTMPANVLNLEGYINFVSAVATDERFTANRMLPEIEKISGGLNPIQKLIYHFLAIPQTRDALINQGSRLSFLKNNPEWGPGRVDTFNPYKAVQFHFPMDKLRKDELIGTADFPSVWNQKAREGLQLHWDGDNTSVDERNKSAALGAGVTQTSIDLPRIQRVADWLWELPAPVYPYEVNKTKAVKGERLFQNNCASCHAFNGSQIGKVVPIQEIGTDPHRLDSYTYELLSNQNTLYASYPWRFSHFRKTNGYANVPLDGIWLRAPYLHNGSVPTLRDLLEVPEKRPKEFYRGYDVFDQEKVGFVSNVSDENDKKYFKFDTTVPGNSNSGHLYGTELSTEDKDALVEYMKKALKFVTEVKGMNTYAQWFSRVTWLGIIANMFFVIPCCFFPEKFLSLLGMHIPFPIIWVQASGLLLFIISVFYIPGAIDPKRYIATAWISIFPSRTFGATFFLIAVFLFGQDKGFLSIAFVDLLFGLIEAILLTLFMQNQNSMTAEPVKQLI